MKRIYISIDNFKSLYNVTRRKIIVLIGGLCVAACSIASPSIAAYDKPTLAYDDIPVQKTRIVDPGIMPQDFINHVSDRIVSISNNEQTSLWNKELDNLTTYSGNWDGEEAEAVQPEAIECSRKLLKAAIDYAPLINAVFPTSFGSVCMEWGAGKNWVSVELASSGVAFYHDRGDENPIYSADYPSLSDACEDDIISHLKQLRNDITC